MNTAMIERMSNWRAQQIFEESKQKLYCQTDRLFARLMVVQYFAGILATIFISSRNSIGNGGPGRWNALAAILFGGILAGYPVLLAWKHPGKTINRYTIVLAQMMFSAFLIHLTGGQAEYFQIFGFLAFLAFYRDTRLLVFATLTTMAEHFVCSRFWPQSLADAATVGAWQSFEHAGWILFEDVFLIISIRSSLHEMFEVAQRRANLEAIKIDIERKIIQRTRDLETEKELLRSLMDNLPDFIFFKDTESRFIRINKSLARHFGLASPQQAIGASDLDYCAPAVAQQYREDDAKIFVSGQPVINRIERSGVAGEVAWLCSSKAAIRDPQGTIIGLVGVTRDITQLRKAESQQRQLEAQLNQAQKLEAVGQLASSIAHEINTPIQYVADNTRFIEENFVAVVKLLLEQEKLVHSLKHNVLTREQIEQVEQQMAAADLKYLMEEIPTAIKETLDGIDRVARIVRAMKEFSHPGTKDKTLVNLNHAINSTITVARNEWKYVADVNLDLQPDLPMVRCFLGEFNQCILNLVINAAHTVGDVVRSQPDVRGIITIQTRKVGEDVEVRVIDTGTGIPESVRSRIFEPFFTTKAVGKGTGQGLAMVYDSIVRKHGGQVSFETEVGKGTSFIIRLPLNKDTTPDEMEHDEMDRLSPRPALKSVSASENLN